MFEGDPSPELIFKYNASSPNRSMTLFFCYCQIKETQRSLGISYDIEIANVIKEKIRGMLLSKDNVKVQISVVSFKVETAQFLWLLLTKST